MGSTLQRLEILLIGLVLVIAGAVVAILMIVHPSTPAVVVSASPTPIATIPAVALTRTISATAAARAAPTPAPIAAAAPAAAYAPPSVSRSGDTTRLPSPMLATAVWPLLLLAVGLIGLPLAMRRFRRRRMSYTNQNVSQLLAAADAETRATNIRIMRDLAQQGVLPAALAAAGIDLPLSPQQQARRLVLPRLPRIAMPHLSFPTLALPTLRWPAAWRRHSQRPITIDGPASAAPTMNHADDRSNRNGEGIAADNTEALIETCIDSSAHSAAAADDQVSLNKRAPLPSAGLSKKEASPHAALTAPVQERSETHTIETVEPAETDLPEVKAPDESTTAWSAEDRVLAAASALARLWVDKAIRSPILAIDTQIGAGDGPVLITLDGHPGEEQLINQVPELIVARHPSWRASWRRSHLEVYVERSSRPSRAAHRCSRRCSRTVAAAPPCASSRSVAGDT